MVNQEFTGTMDGGLIHWIVGASLGPFTVTGKEIGSVSRPSPQTAHAVNITTRDAPDGSPASFD